jgi:hypothetical protein
MCHRNNLDLFLIDREVNDIIEATNYGKANIELRRGEFTLPKSEGIFFDLNEFFVDGAPEFSAKSGTL